MDSRNHESLRKTEYPKIDYLLNVLAIFYNFPFFQFFKKNSQNFLNDDFFRKNYTKLII